MATNERHRRCVIVLGVIFAIVVTAVAIGVIAYSETRTKTRTWGPGKTRPTTTLPPKDGWKKDDTIREEILKYLSDWCEDYNNQRFDTLAEKFHQPDSIIIVPGRPEITYSEINKAWAEFYDNGWDTIEIVCDRFFITDHQVAVYNHAIGRDKGGNEVGTSRAGVVFQKRNGTWYSIMSAVVD